MELQTKLPRLRLSTLLMMPLGFAIAFLFLPALDQCAALLFPDAIDFKEGIYWGVPAGTVHPAVSTLLFRLDSIILLGIFTAMLCPLNTRASDACAVATLLAYPVEEVRLSQSSSPFSDRYTLTHNLWTVSSHSLCFAFILTFLTGYLCVSLYRPQWSTEKVRNIIATSVLACFLLLALVLRSELPGT